MSAAVSIDEYQAVRAGAGMLTRGDRGLLAVIGVDRATYLQGLLTNDVVALESGSGCYAAYLTPQGRMIADLEVMNLGDLLLLDVPGRTRELLRHRLSEFVFTEDVQIADWTDQWIAIGIHGPRAADVVARALAGSGAPGSPAAADLLSLRANGNRVLGSGDDRIILARRDELGLTGFWIGIRREDLDRWHSVLNHAGAIDMSSETAEVFRVEAGRPLYGVDMDEDTIPLEAGIENRAISFTKGCYVGQEVIFRVMSRGHGRVARRLVGLQLEGADDAVTHRGATLWHADKEVGRVTSAVWSPARSGVVAMGYVHRDLATEGSMVEVDTAAGRRPARVILLAPEAPH
jgi:folate-binding protein YgfZ